jgi:hypothetical protein
MHRLRISLSALALAALAASVTAFDRAPDPLERTDEYKHSRYVFQGEVKKMSFVNGEGKEDSSGEGYSLDLAVSVVHKAPNGAKRPAKEDVVSITGRRADKEKKKTFVVPKEKDLVIAFLKRKKDDRYEALEPTGFKVLSREGSRDSPKAPDSQPKKKTEKKTKD